MSTTAAGQTTEDTRVLRFPDSMRHPALWLTLLTVLVYAPGLGGGFVYDDHFLLLDNPWLTKGSFRDAFTINFWPLPPANWRSLIYRPMGILGHLVLYRIFGLSPFAFHAASILLHAAATVAVFFLLKGLRFRIGVATAAAALFAVHPLHVEAVAWMSQLTEVMAGTGVLAALAFFVYNRKHGRQLSSFIARGNPSGGWANASLEMVFIRAPVIERVGPGVQVLAECRGSAVLVRQQHLLASTFHPELSNDLGVHQYFLDMTEYPRTQGSSRK